MPASHKTKIAIGKCHRLIEERTNLSKWDATVLMSDILKILEKERLCKKMGVRCFS